MAAGLFSKSKADWLCRAVRQLMQPEEATAEELMRHRLTESRGNLTPELKLIPYMPILVEVVVDGKKTQLPPAIGVAAGAEVMAQQAAVGLLVFISTVEETEGALMEQPTWK
jgi:hypothetical protein